MIPTRPNLRLLAEQCADHCATIVTIVPAELREAVFADLLTAFWNVCAQHGVPVQWADIEHYSALITERLVKAGHLETRPTRH